MTGHSCAWDWAGCQGYSGGERASSHLCWSFVSLLLSCSLLNSNSSIKKHPQRCACCFLTSKTLPSQPIPCHTLTFSVTLPFADHSVTTNSFTLLHSYHFFISFQKIRDFGFFNEIFPAVSWHVRAREILGECVNQCFESEMMEWYRVGHLDVPGGDSQDRLPWGSDVHTESLKKKKAGNAEWRVNIVLLCVRGSEAGLGPAGAGSGGSGCFGESYKKCQY